MQHVTLAVTSTAPPTLRWSCPSCRHGEFACSERFRMNTNGKLADIWLLYRCEACGTTRNLAVIERTPIGRIDRTLVEAAIANDPAAARRFARDLTLIRRAGTQVARGDRHHLDRTQLEEPGVIGLTFPEPLVLRLDHVVADALGVPRSRVTSLLAQGVIRPTNAGPRVDKLRLWHHAELRVQATTSG